MERDLMSQASSTRSLTRSAAAVGALVVVLVVVPVLLITEGGSPVPSGGLHRLRQLLASHQGFDAHIVTSWLVHGALLLAWVTWSWMAVCIVIEAYSWVTGRPPAHLPGSRTMQAMAACLVGTSMAMISISATLPASHPGRPASPVSRPGPSGAFNLRVIDDYGFGLAHPGAEEASLLDSLHPMSGAPPVSPSSASDSTVTEEMAIAQPRGAAPGDGPVRIHVVAGRETLWSIAEDQLGSARRWRELAALNYSVPQADGQTLTRSHWIRPGWQLVLPPTSPNLPEGDTNTASDTYAAGAAPAVELATFRTAQPNAPGSDEITVARQQPGAGLSTGWVGEVERVGEAPVPLVGAGLLGAGLVSLLERMRRTQQRRREQGGFIRLPDPRRGEMERLLRIGEGRGTVLAIDGVLKLFRRVCIDRGIPVPLVRGVEVHATEIELLVDRPMDRGEFAHPFAVRSDGSSVVILNADISGVPDDGYNPFPTLVTVGNEAGRSQLVNLEALGSLELVGDPVDCEGVIRALALEMATSYWADQFDLELVGFGNELTRFNRVASSSDPELVLQRLQHRREVGEELLRSSSYRSFSQARIFEDLDTWDPLVVICGPGAVDAERAELVRSGSDPRTGTSVIAPGSGRSASRVWNVSNGLSSPMDLFSSVPIPQGITPDQLADIGELVDTANDHDSVGADAHPYRDMSIPMPLDFRESSVRIRDVRIPTDPESGPIRVGQAREAGTKSGAEVEVAVLGPVEVRGAEHEFSRPWAKELVVYLAMHPNGAANEAWATALWPDRLMASSSLHSTASVARRSLGHARDGEDHLPKAHGRLRLAGSVSTDWARFVESADGRHVEGWKKALELVRGRLFDGLRSSDWPILEGTAPAMEATIVDVAGRLAGAYLQQGNEVGAEWAARRGLLVSPYDERLYRMLLRAADQAGNPAGVESVMSELIRLVADEVEPFDSVHPSTMELYRSLSRRKTVATSRR
jgi:DNA-binding SARP family transcriptional activator